jgi:hypothetical protein
MSLYKSSQYIDLMDADDLMKDLGNEDEVIMYEERPSEDEVIELHQPDSKMSSIELTFKLPPLPGSDAEIPLEVSTDDAIEVEDKGDDGKKSKDKNDAEEEKVVEIQDHWNPLKTHGPEKVFDWYKDRINSIPKHSGREISGIERVIAYLTRMDREMSKVIANDYDGKVDIAAFENARTELHHGVDRLEKALETLKKSMPRRAAEVQYELLVKEGQKATHVGGIIVTVPIFISRLARICINGMVSAGKDIEDIYARLVKKYALNEREQAELMQLLSDMNFPLRRDRGYNTDELIDQTSENNFEWTPSYPS